ncbi:mannosyltransferase [Parabacteroides bouchesdurhonensis]|uniref:mannosyltransferase n=1 Tax=Parabacteroides bouchesdurhonensis TaxID=1936995 RepID=UPI000C816837|nr:mannosyltransferase [Parabacteroides bouchesdurhonensis]
MDKYLNIIAFNIPWPANYGGVIDVYYKLMVLHNCGVKIILHCFEYERPRAKELEHVCEKVYYYKRRTGILSNITLLPYNVYSRKDPALLTNLLKNDYPILFEGLHSCYYINNPLLKNRMKIFRECNIEHDYYYHLYKSEHQLIKKCFFLIEAWRFKTYQMVISNADLIISVSTTDANYLQKEFSGNHIEFIPCFHANEQITARPGKSDFILYHGKLSVVENERAALYLIHNVFCKLSNPCILAGMNPSQKLLAAAAIYPNITIEANPSDERMDFLIHEAQINMLITFQDTGLKLKLLNSLFAGRHTVVNRLMLAGSGLDSLCCIADTPEEMIHACNNLMNVPLDESAIIQRRKLLEPFFSNKYQGSRLYKMIYEE